MHLRRIEQPLGLMLDDERIQHAFGDEPLLRRELPQCLELELKRLIGATFGVPKDQFVQCHAESEGDLFEQL